MFLHGLVVKPFLLSLNVSEPRNYHFPDHNEGPNYIINYKLNAIPEFQCHSEFTLLSVHTGIGGT